MVKKNTSRGFSLLELLLVLAILAILAAVILPQFSKFRRSSTLNTDTMNVVTLINRARLLSVSAKNDTRYGVHLEAGQIVLFEGATYTAGASTNEVFVLSDGVTFSGTTINGGGSEILFEKITGDTNNNATTTMSIVGGDTNVTLVVNPSGVVATQ